MKLNYIDTHTHLNLKRLRVDIDQHLANCEINGISQLIVPGIDVDSSLASLELADKYPDRIKSAVGIHPEEVLNPNFKFEFIDQIEAMITHPQIVAIGEIGLDYYYAKTSIHKQKQLKLFKKQIEIGRKFNKSLIIHNRESSNDLIKLLESNWSPNFDSRVVFHCCEPNLDLLKIAIKHHIFIGIDGDITYDTKKQDFIRQVPLDILVLETDSPFLLPEPLRTAKTYPNSPANLPIIAQWVARVKNISINDISNNTNQNAKKLFNLD